MEFNELVTVPGSDWLELRHVRDYPSEKGHIIIARFNSSIVSRAQVEDIAILLGCPLPAQQVEFLDEVGRGNFSKWEIKN